MCHLLQGTAETTQQHAPSTGACTKHKRTHTHTHTHTRAVGRPPEPFFFYSFVLSFFLCFPTTLLVFMYSLAHLLFNFLSLSSGGARCRQAGVLAERGQLSPAQDRRRPARVGWEPCLFFFFWCWLIRLGRCRGPGALQRLGRGGGLGGGGLDGSICVCSTCIARLLATCWRRSVPLGYARRIDGFNAAGDERRRKRRRRS